MKIKRSFLIPAILAATSLHCTSYGIAVGVGPMYYDREGGDTEMRLASVSISSSRWSLKDGEKEEKESSVSLMILRPQPDIIGINVEKSEITVLRDDKETDFLKKRQNTDGAADIIEVTPSSSHSQILNFRINTPGLPHPVATKLRIEGTIVLITGVNRITVENRNVLLKEGSEINAGPYMLQITKVGTPDVKKFPWVADRGAVSLTIESENSRRIIREMQFMDENGNHAGVSMVGSTSSDENSKNIYEYIVMNKMDKLTVKVSYWSGVEETSLPFKFETGLDAEVKDVK